MKSKIQVIKHFFKKIFYNFRGFIVITLLTVNTLLFGFILFTGGALSRLIPFRKLRITTLKFVFMIYQLWIDINKIILWLSIFGKITIKGSDHLDPKGWYLLIANHNSWFDILLITTSFNHKIPSFKFFMKKELIWTLPIAGLACYFLDFPMLSRHTPEQIKKNPQLKGHDIEIARQACEKIKELPTTMISFAEGTRFTAEKAQRQQSPYQFLLKPKVGGIAVVLNELQNLLTGVIDITIHYPQNVSFWDLVSGNFSKIYLYYQVHPLLADLKGNYMEDRDYRIKLQLWLNQVWKNKDELLKKFMAVGGLEK